MDYFEVDALSNSKLSKLDPDLSGNPYKFLNVDEEGEYKSGLAKGVHVHLTSLEGKILYEVNAPSDGERRLIEAFYQENPKMSEFDWNSPAFAKMIEKASEDAGIYVRNKIEYKIDKFRNNLGYYNFLKNSNGKIVISTSDAEDVRIMNERLKPYIDRLKNPMPGRDILVELECYYMILGGSALIYNSDGEYTDIDFEAKSKLDLTVIDHELKEIWIRDVKTDRNFISDYPKSSFIRRKHYRQLAMYDIAFREWCRENKIDISDYKINHSIIAIMNKAPYFYEEFYASPDWIEYGKKELNLLLERVGFHKLNDLWDYSMEHYIEGNTILFDEKKFDIETGEKKEVVFK